MKHNFELNLIAFLLLLVSFTSCKNEKAADFANAKAVAAEYKIPGTLKWAERIAQSVMKRNPEAWQIDQYEEPEWDYVHGLVLKTFLELHEETGKEKYFDYVKDYADELIDSTGTIKTKRLKIII